MTVHFPGVVDKHFKDYQSKPVTRRAYQLTDEDIDRLSINQTTGRANLILDNCHVLSLAFHCELEEIKAGDYVVFITEEDTYHCSEEIFKERNIC